MCDVVLTTGFGVNCDIVGVGSESDDVVVGSVDVGGTITVDPNVGIAGKLAMGGIVPRWVYAEGEGVGINGLLRECMCVSVCV